MQYSFCFNFHRRVFWFAITDRFDNPRIHLRGLLWNQYNKHSQCLKIVWNYFFCFLTGPHRLKLIVPSKRPLVFSEMKHSTWRITNHPQYLSIGKLQIWNNTNCCHLQEYDLSNSELCQPMFWSKWPRSLLYWAKCYLSWARYSELKCFFI